MYERSNSVVNVTLYMDNVIDSGASAECTLPLALHEFPFFMEFSAVDPTVGAAAMKAIENNDVMPILKEELKNRIQSRRIAEGKDELTVDFTVKPKPELTDIEKEKVERRRLQNRNAARRFREKEKALETKLQKKSQKLESDNTTLRTQIRELRRELETLQSELQQHLSVCPYVNGPYMQLSFS